MLFRFTRIFVAAGLLLGLWALVRARTADPAKMTAGAAGPVKILQFYANVGMLNMGEKALLCYGVENARSVELSPKVEALKPALSRCVEVAPLHTTHYTLMAEGFDGKVAIQSITLTVNPAPPRPPQILHFAGTKVGGRAVQLCYEVKHAHTVKVEPAVLAPTAAQ